MRGYTLIELIIVVVMIGILTAFAIPAFSRYGDFVEYKNKVSEIKGFIEQTQILSKNPEQGILAYATVVSTADQKLYLKKCTDKDCLINPSIIRTIDLNGGTNQFGTQVLQLPAGPATTLSLICQSKAQDDNCLIDPMAIDYFSLHYSSSKVSRTAVFTMRVSPSFRLTIDNLPS